LFIGIRTLYLTIIWDGAYFLCWKRERETFIIRERERERETFITELGEGRKRQYREK
jgi:hypothetical protein